ncbi:MAG: hypothetical protein RL341_728 [Pseudomonadota bacterium]|jgi:type II secretion system protein J
MKHARADGFTLIELLVALTILALMSTLAWRGLDAVLRSRDAAIAVRDKVNHLNSTLEQMAADVRSATSGRAASPITLFANGFALQRELAQANGPSQRGTVQWQLSEGKLLRIVRNEPPGESTVLQVLPEVKSWAIAVFVDGNWLPSEEWLKRQSQDSPAPRQPQAGIIQAPTGFGNAGRILALSIRLDLPGGPVVKVLLGESI